MPRRRMPRPYFSRASEQEQPAEDRIQARNIADHGIDEEANAHLTDPWFRKPVTIVNLAREGLDLTGDTATILPSDFFANIGNALKALPRNDREDAARHVMDQGLQVLIYGDATARPPGERELALEIARSQLYNLVEIIRKPNAEDIAVRDKLLENRDYGRQLIEIDQEFPRGERQAVMMQRGLVREDETFRSDCKWLYRNWFNVGEYLIRYCTNPRPPSIRSWLSAMGWKVRQISEFQRERLSLGQRRARAPRRGPRPLSLGPNAHQAHAARDMILEYLRRDIDVPSHKAELALRSGCSEHMVRRMIDHLTDRLARYPRCDCDRHCSDFIE